MSDVLTVHSTVGSIASPELGDQIQLGVQVTGIAPLPYLPHLPYLPPVRDGTEVAQIG